MKALALGLLLLGVRLGSAEEVVVVMGADHRPYREALSGFRDAFGRPVTVLGAGQAGELPRDARLVVAIGGRAASRNYPRGVRLVYGLAPGLLLERPNTTTVFSFPRADAMMPRLKELQPGIKNFAVLWTNPAFEPNLEDFQKAARDAGVNLVSQRVAGPQRLPGVLRSLVGRADALWVPPDPQLLTPEALETIKAFSWANDVPFYGATAGMIDYGATAAVYASFRELGRALAEAAQSPGGDAPRVFWPRRISVSINEEAAEESGLRAR